MTHNKSLSSSSKLGILGGAIAIVAAFFIFFEFIVVVGSVEASARIAERSETK